ncbi:MAG: helix-turn-helix domain-containing protein, partial [Neglectibacter sp.]
MTTGERLRAARISKGMTQKEVGEKCGIAEPTIRRYELGKLNPKLETLQRIAAVLHVDVNWLKTGVDLEQSV